VGEILGTDGKPINGPAIIVKKRPYQPTYRKSVVVEPRYWKHKETGTIVEVRELKLDVTENKLIVSFYDPGYGHERSMPLKSSRPHPFFPGEIERHFELDYEPYGNSSAQY
jgi:hypothetical protein